MTHAVSDFTLSPLCGARQSLVTCAVQKKQQLKPLDRIGSRPFRKYATYPTPQTDDVATSALVPGGIGNEGCQTGNASPCVIIHCDRPTAERLMDVSCPLFSQCHSLFGAITTSPSWPHFPVWRRPNSAVSPRCSSGFEYY